MEPHSEFLMEKCRSQRHTPQLECQNRINSSFPGSSIIKKQIDEGVKKIRVGIKPETKVIAREKTKIF